MLTNASVHFVSAAAIWKSQLSARLMPGSRDRTLYAGDNGLLHIAQAQIHLTAEAAVVSRPALSALESVAHGVQGRRLR